MTFVWNRVADVLLRLNPGGDDERQRQARIIAAVKVQSDATLVRVAKTLRRIGDDLAEARR